MSNELNIYNTDIFSGFEAVITTAAKPTSPISIDPIDELRNASGTIEIRYTPRAMRSMVPFMDFLRKSDRRWLNLLLTELQVIRLKSPQDTMIMTATATAKRGLGRGSTKQTWQEFIDELVNDKVHTGKDFSEGQLKHLPNLLAALAKGKTLAGCGTIAFVNANDGEVLS